MNEHQIICFLNVVDAGSFSKAAAKIHLSQPAITHQISALEKELDVSLFRRHSSGAALTEMGERFLPAARTLLDAFGNARSSLQKPPGEDTPFILGVPRAMMLNTAVYQELMRNMSEHFPSFSVEVREVTGAMDICNDLKNGIDCVITMDLGDEMLRRRELKAFPIFRPQCQVSMSRKNPLYPKTEVTAEELKDFKLYYAQYERHFINVVTKHLPEDCSLNFMETPTPLTATPALIAGKACFISPSGGDRYSAEHMAVLKLESELPFTSAFFLRSRINPLYEAIAAEIQKAHLVGNYLISD